jgi:hypothetical protein
VIARVFQKPGEVPCGRKHRLGGPSAAAGESCFSDSTTSASIGGGGGGGASASSRPLLTVTDTSSPSLFVANANAAASNNNGNPVTGRELVPCFSTTASPLEAAALGVVGHPYNAAPLRLGLDFEAPSPGFVVPNLRSLQVQDDGGLPLFLSAAAGGGMSSATLGIMGSLGGSLHCPPHAGMDVVKVEGRAAPPQMAVGPGLLDGAFAWGF